MITLYEEKDLVSLGNYLLSEERKNRTSKINRDKVTDADIRNWREKETLGS